MIASVLLYGIAMAALLSIAATLAERCCTQLGWPRRFVWIAAVAASLVIPFVGLFIADPSAVRYEDARVPWEMLRQDVSSDARLTVPVWDAVLACLWGCGTFAMLLAFVRSWWRFARVCSRWPRVRIERCEARVSHRVGPAVFGLRKPIVILPRWLLKASPTVRRSALAHELEHLAVRDHVVLFVMQVMLILFPWNIPLWWQRHRLRLAIEIDCDARVLRSGLDPTRYAEALLSVDENRAMAPRIATALTWPSQLERRIRSMLTRGTRAPMWHTLAFSLLTLTVAACATKLDAPILRTDSGSQESSLPEVSHNGVEFSSRSVNVLSPTVEAPQETMVLGGDVVIRAPKAMTMRWEADHASQTPEGIQLDGNVSLRMNGTKIVATRALIRTEAAGDTVVSTDSATVTTSRP